MKNLILASVLLFSSYIGFSQAPESLSYQAVIHTSAKVVLTNTLVGTRISVLKGGSNGNVVYTETHAVSTNENGLISLAIGTGASTDDFTAIEWDNGVFFVKCETDPNGAANYSIITNTQLLSVPYALYAKTSGSSTPGPKGDDGVGGVSTAGTGINVTGDGTVAVPYVISTSVDLAALVARLDSLEDRLEVLEPKPAVVGEYRDGGVVFWVDPTDNTHGLICAIENPDVYVRYRSDGGYVESFATDSAIGTGKANSDKMLAIVNGQNASRPGAAVVADEYEHDGFTDWYLPSALEVLEMLNNKTIINTTSLAQGGTSLTGGANYLWSSTEYTQYRSALLYVHSPYNRVSGDKYAGNRMRPIRSF